MKRAAFEASLGQEGYKVKETTLNRTDIRRRTHTALARASLCLTARLRSSSVPSV